MNLNNTMNVLSLQTSLTLKSYVIILMVRL